MGLIRDLRTALSAPQHWGTPPPALASPWAQHPSHLETIVLHDLFADVPRPLNRAEAMRVPTVARARRLICGSLARMSLHVWLDGENVTPLWLRRTDRELAPWHRMLWTADDLMFYGWSLWELVRGSEGEVLEATRVRPDRWHVDDSGAIVVDGRTPSADELCLIPGPDEGLLQFGDVAIRHASKLIAAADRAADTPTPAIDLHQTNDAPMTDEDRQRLVGQWARARRGEHGGVAMTSKGIEARELGSIAEQLLIEGRNAASVDVARACGIPASMVDATGPKASLSYETAEGKASEFINYGLAPFMSAITSRLSLDDMTPRGHVPRFDQDDLIGPLAARIDTTESPAEPPTEPNPVPEGVHQ